MRMQLSLLVPILIVAKVLARGVPSVSKDYISGNTTTGPSTVQFTSLSSGFDAPKVHELNNTAFDWWYFDAVASDLSASAVIVIFTAQQSGLWPDLPNLGTATWVSGLFTFPNATAADIFLPAESLTVLTVDDGSSGTLGGLNAGWAGTPDMSAYVFSVDEPDAGLQGSITLASVSITEKFMLQLAYISFRLLLPISHALQPSMFQGSRSLSALSLDGLMLCLMPMQRLTSSSRGLNCNSLVQDIMTR